MHGTTLYTINCPYHDDENPSAYIIAFDNSRGVLKCYACGAKVTGTVEERGSFVDFTPRSKRWELKPKKQLSRKPRSKKSGDIARACLITYARTLVHLYYQNRLPAPNETLVGLWTEYLRLKQIHVEDLPSVPNPPVIHGGLIWPLLKVERSAQVRFPYDSNDAGSILVY